MLLENDFVPIVSDWTVRFVRLGKINIPETSSMIFVKFLLSHPQPSSVTVACRTEGGSATNSLDYVIKDRRITLAPGKTVGRSHITCC